MIVDVVMLTLTSNKQLFKMTQNAINSLKESETNIEFNIILLESNKESKFIYDNCVYITPDFDFNYNRFMNFGMSLSNNEYVVLCNNDLIFYKNWFTEILKYKDIADSFAPWNNYNNWHKRMIGELTEDYKFGYRTSYELAGWCIVAKRKIFDIFKLDERVDFWYSDNVYTDALQQNNIKHILVRNSIVDHLCSKTPLGEKEQDLTNKQIYKYRGF